MDNIYAGVAAVPMIVGLVQVAKALGLAERFAPLVSMAFGLALSLGSQFVQGGDPRSWLDAVVIGLALGLSASGLYSSGKTAVDVRLGR